MGSRRSSEFLGGLARIDLPNLRGEGAGVVARGIDKDRQEDAREIAFGPNSALTLKGAGESAFLTTHSIGAAPAGRVTLSGGEVPTDITQGLTVAAGKGWREIVITPVCLGAAGDSLTLATDAPMTISIASIARQPLPEGTQCSFRAVTMDDVCKQGSRGYCLLADAENGTVTHRKSCAPGRGSSHDA